MKFKNLKKYQRKYACLIRMLPAVLILFAFTPLKAGSTLNVYNLVVQQEISGTIVDASGNPIPGVNVLVVGMTTGTMADFDGKYTITANDGQVLRFSSIGYKTIDVTVGAQASYNITMEEDVNSLNEVVVVGYGSTIKRNLTSSVATVSADEMAEIPATSLSNAIAGRLAGVTIEQSNGKPGSTSAITVRGATSGGFAGNSLPLYVIDNVIATKSLFDALDVSEVKNVTVLKDAASAAVYGARAANGVVLVTTKTGKSGKSVINFTQTIGTTEPTNIPPMMNAFQKATINESQMDFNGVPANDAARLNQTEWDYLKNYKSQTFAEEASGSPVLTRTALSASGGSEKITYFMSGSYVNQTGDFAKLKYKKTNFRANVAADITENLNVSMNMSTNNDVRDEFYWRWNGSDEDFGDFYRTANRTGIFAPGIHNGEYVANFNGWNPVHLADGGAGNNTRKARNINAIIDVNYKVPFVEGLTAGLTYNRLNQRTDQTLFKKVTRDVTFGVDPNNRFLLTDDILGVRVRSDDGADSDSLEEGTAEEDSYQFNARVAYNKVFGDHTANGFFNYEVWERYDRNFWGRRRGLQTEFVTQLFATDPAAESQFANGGGGEFGRASYIGGLGYNYKERLFINTTFRYDGSTKFSEAERWGFFPSISLGWIASDESFMYDNTIFDFLKVRFSAGTTGNDNVGSSNFPYLQSYNVGGSGAVFGESESTSNSAAIGPQPDIFITWEKQTSYNLGFDMQFLESKLSTTLDIWKNVKTDLYGSRQEFIPSSSGLTLGNTNYGGIDIKGIDLVASYKDNLSEDFSFDLGFNLGYAKDKYTSLDEPETRRGYELLLGNGTSRIWGLTALGIIRTQEQLDDLIASGYTYNNAAPQIGALYYKDLRGNAQVDPDGNTPDGNIDGNDNSYIGSAGTAPVSYGVRLNLNYKRFSLQAFAQGFAGHQAYQPANNRFNFGGYENAAHIQFVDSWTPDNINASMPRFGSPGQDANSTFWLQDADFLRMKNLNLAYDIPESIVSKIGAERISIFGNGTNLFMIYSKIDEFDPETSGRGIPVNRSYSLGINVTF
ncbi:TonB-dependent receptor [Cellulophaga sp. F20128]|uniref:SusC/RagA family TonB-linked outer membrane protein n=1 Tax=Cellulophaga sp. F20128 TaxID=2926413 RepID=UPI001FF6D950|nr:TonB-dependent receptor [Cellulophaga sp. F20128]MCK0156304.1 TonB-dependent receptor [Cellulophaga sp. F20128]